MAHLRLRIRSLWPLWLALAGAAVLALILIGPPLLVAPYGITDPDKRFADENALRTTLAGVLGGLAVLGSAVVGALYLARNWRALEETDITRLWPYDRRLALLAPFVVLIVLGAALGLTRRASGWPPSSSDNLVLTGIFVFSLIPVVLIVIDLVATRGGSVKVAGVEINIVAAITPTQSVTIAPNIGVPGEPIYDSTSTRILDAIRQAVSSDIVTIDLETGRAWWETRLLVLCAGAVRLRRPGVIVFLATEAEAPRQFQGWAHPEPLLALLLASNPGYRQSYRDARVATAQWSVVTPPGPGMQSPPVPPDANMLARLGGSVAPFTNGELNEMAMEQFLALALGQFEGHPLEINLGHLKGALASPLHTEAIDRNWAPEQQTVAFLSSDSPYIALTERGRYVGLLPRIMGQNSILRAIVERDQVAAR